MLSKVFRVRIRRFHRWAGILIGIQLLFWITSGVYFAWMPFKTIKDEDRRAEVTLEPLPLSRMVAPLSLAIPEEFKVKAIHLEPSPMGAIYKLESLDGAVALFDAFTGMSLPILDREKVAMLALTQIKSEAAPSNIRLMSKPGEDYKGPVPVYQIILGDFRQTRLYVNPWTGKIMASRNRFWRIYDFLWMLHIMDFKEREDFNNMWLRILSIGAWIFVISGYALFVYGRPPKRPSKV